MLEETIYREHLATARAHRGVLGEADQVMAQCSVDLEEASATGECDDALAIGRRLVTDLERLIAEWPSRASARNIDQPVEISLHDLAESDD